MTRSMLNTSIPSYGSPRWAGDYMHPEHLVPAGGRLDATSFTAYDAVIVNVGAAGALATATTVPVDALSGPIPKGTVLYFGGQKVAVLSADAAKGATSIAVNALPTALVDADVTTYAGIGLRNVESGTPIGRTYAESAAGTAYGLADAADDEIWLLAFDISNAIGEVDCTLYRGNSVVYENFLPANYQNAASGVKTKVRAKYIVQQGQV
jgi:hypothetical protein